MSDTQRYWDGAHWTDHLAPGLPQRTQAADAEQNQEKRTNGLAAAGIVMMIIFPIGGFIAGCMLLSRKALPGVLIMVFSVASAYVWYDIYAEQQQQECLTDNIDRAMSGLPTLDCG